MLTKSEIKELEILAEKHNAVSSILDFYNEINSNGAKLLFMQINKKLTQIAEDIGNATFSITSDKDDKAFDRFIKLSGEMSTILENHKKMDEYINGTTDSDKLKKPRKGHEDKVVF